MGQRNDANTTIIVWNGGFLSIGQCASFCFKKMFLNFFYFYLISNAYMKFCTTFESYALLYLLLKYSLLLLVCIPLTWRTRGVRNTFLLFFFSWKISTRAQFSKKNSKPLNVICIIFLAVLALTRNERHKSCVRSFLQIGRGFILI